MQLSFARVCSNKRDFNHRNQRHSELIINYNVGLKTLLQQGILQPVFYGDFVYIFIKFKRIKPYLIFQISSKISSGIIKAWVLCNSLHVWLLTQSQFKAMVSFLIAGLWVRRQTQLRPRPKTFMGGSVPDAWLWLNPPRLLLKCISQCW